MLGAKPRTFGSTTEAGLGAPGPAAAYEGLIQIVDRSPNVRREGWVESLRRGWQRKSAGLGDGSTGGYWLQELGENCSGIYRMEQPSVFQVMEKSFFMVEVRLLQASHFY